MSVLADGIKQGLVQVIAFIVFIIIAGCLIYLGWTYFLYPFLKTKLAEVPFLK